VIDVLVDDRDLSTLSYYTVWTDLRSPGNAYQRLHWKKARPQFFLFSRRFQKEVISPADWKCDVLDHFFVDDD
jgi:hypothetical protein